MGRKSKRRGTMRRCKCRDCGVIESRSLGEFHRVGRPRCRVCGGCLDVIPWGTIGSTVLTRDKKREGFLSLEEFQAKAATLGMDVSEGRQLGHWNIWGGANGPCSYWPYGKKRSFMFLWTHEVQQGVDFDAALALAMGSPLPQREGAEAPAAV